MALKDRAVSALAEENSKRQELVDAFALRVAPTVVKEWWEEEESDMAKQVYDIAEAMANEREKRRNR